MFKPQLYILQEKPFSPLTVLFNPLPVVMERELGITFHV
jgi:hypothetical protein